MLQYYFDRNNTYDNMEKFLICDNNFCAFYQAEFEGGYVYPVRNDNMFLIDREGNCLT